MSLKQWLRGVDHTSLDRVLLLDGGVSTLLEHQTTEGFRHRQLWSSSLLLDNEGKNLIENAHSKWIDAGADIISTVTYQCHFEESLWPSDVFANADAMKQMYDEAVERARAARKTYHKSGDAPKFLVVSSGCFGAALSNGAEYTGDYGVSSQRLEDFHRTKLDHILGLNVDGVAVETVPSLQECEVLVKIIESTDLKETALWISLSCRNQTELNDGTPLEKALEVLTRTSKIDAIGLNCCGVDEMCGLSRRLARFLSTRKIDCAIALYPNSGEVWDAHNQTWKEGSGCMVAKDMAAKMMDILKLTEDEWRRNQPSRLIPRIVLGGCCRTSPETIAAIRVLVDEHLRGEYKGWF